MKSARRQSHIVLAFVFILAAAGFTVMAWEDYDFQSNSVSVIGRVDKVEKRKSESSRAAGDTFVVTFRFEAAGIVYRNQQKLDEPTTIGPATVWYDPSDPTKSRIKLPSPIGDMLIAFACAVGAIIYGQKARKRKES